MKWNNVAISNMAYVDAPVFLSSDEIEKRLAPVYERLRLPEGRLELQTSIKTRGFWKVGEKPSHIASLAARKILDTKPELRQEIDLLIYSGVCRDFLEPSTASMVHGELGLRPECQFFDLSNACLGFMQAIFMASNLIEAKVIRKALIVTGENAGPLLEETVKFLNTDESITRKTIKPYFANLTLGSAGVAFVITNMEDKDALIQVEAGTLLTDSSASDLCQGDGNTGSLMMQTDSEKLLVAGINLAKNCHDKFLAENNFSRESFSHFINHQVGIAHRNLLYQELELDLAKDFSTFPKYGNTGSAALPLTLCKAYEAKTFKPQDKIALLGIGSGLHSLMMGAKCLKI